MLLFITLYKTPCSVSYKANLEMWIVFVFFSDAVCIDMHDNLFCG